LHYEIVPDAFTDESIQAVIETWEDGVLALA
jgi:hypothetical protein